MRYQTVLFDLDGTLVDNSRGIFQGFRYALERLGIPEEGRLDRRVIGPPLRRGFAERFGVPEEDLERAVALYREYYRPTGVLECDLYPGVEEMLRTLHASGVSLWLATSKAEVFARQILEHFNLTGLFGGIVGSELSGGRDTKAEVITHILRQLPADGFPALMVGDRDQDAAGAQDMGLDMAVVLWGFGSRAEFEGFGCVQAFFDTAPALTDWILEERG